MARRSSTPRRPAPLAVFAPILVPIAALITLLGGLVAQGTAAAGSGHDWNEGAIEWVGFLEGMDRIEKTGRPGILIFYTDWCPHCQSYSRVFQDPEIVRLSRRFVMIRVDRDREPALNDLYGEKGGYVPRTLFLDADGKVDWSVQGQNAGFPFFLDEDDPAELRGLMRRFAARSPAGRATPRPASPAAR